MDSDSILKYIKPRIKEAIKHDSRCHKAMVKGELEKERIELQELEQILQQVKDWMEAVLGGDQEELCKLLTEKSTGGPLLPLSTNEPEHQEVIIALRLFTDTQLSNFLPPQCMDQYKRFRESVKHLKMFSDFP